MLNKLIDFCIGLIPLTFYWNQAYGLLSYSRIYTQMVFVYSTKIRCFETTVGLKPRFSWIQEFTLKEYSKWENCVVFIYFLAIAVLITLVRSQLMNCSVGVLYPRDNVVPASVASVRAEYETGVPWLGVSSGLLDPTHNPDSLPNRSTELCMSFQMACLISYKLVTWPSPSKPPLFRNNA